MSLSIIGTHTIVTLVVAAAQCQRMLLSKTCPAHFVEPVHAASEIYTCISPSETFVAVLLCIHHLQFLIDEIPRQLAGVGSMSCAVLTAFLCGNHNHTIGTTCTIDG